MLPLQQTNCVGDLAFCLLLCVLFNQASMLAITLTDPRDVRERLTVMLNTSI